MRQRHGRKYYAKPVKEAKDHSWREVIVRLVLQVIFGLIQVLLNLSEYYFLKCIETGSRPTITLPVLDHEESVRVEIKKPAKADAVQAHKSRLLL